MFRQCPSIGPFGREHDRKVKFVDGVDGDDRSRSIYRACVQCVARLNKQVLKRPCFLAENKRNSFCIVRCQSTEETVYAMMDEVKQAAVRLLFLLDYAVMPR